MSVAKDLRHRLVDERFQETGLGERAMQMLQSGVHPRSAKAARHTSLFSISATLRLQALLPVEGSSGFGFLHSSPLLFLLLFLNLLLHLLLHLGLDRLEHSLLLARGLGRGRR